MKKDFKILIITCCILVFGISNSYACRFWGAIGEKIPSELIINHLVEMPNSLKFLGEQYDDGWSVGYYNDTEEVVYRGSAPSNLDQVYESKAREIAGATSDIYFAHLRRASSGCVEGVPNPHPFVRNKNGVRWLFGHNGGMKKQVLIDLIGEEYLSKNPPETCDYDPPDSWIDSELYFIFLLREIEAHNWNVEKGLQVGLNTLYDIISKDQRYLNFFLTDGETLWAFRKGTSLYYYNDQSVSVVSSTVPESTKANWEVFPENRLGVFKKDSPPQFIAVQY